MVEYGFVAEPHRNTSWLVFPATRKDEQVTCYDLAGFCGSWQMKLGGEFFLSPNNSSLCAIAMHQANNFAQEKNQGKANDRSD